MAGNQVLREPPRGGVVLLRRLGPVEQEEPHLVRAVFLRRPQRRRGGAHGRERV